MPSPVPSAALIGEALQEPNLTNFENSRSSENILYDRFIFAAADMSWSTEAGKIYQKWRQCPAARNGFARSIWLDDPWGPDEDRMKDELGGIAFGAIQALGQRLDHLANACQPWLQGTVDIQNQLKPPMWTGEAHDAAMAKFDQAKDSIQSYATTLKQAAARVLDASTHMEREIFYTTVADTKKIELAKTFTVDDFEVRSIQIDAIQQRIGS